jgi:hypothetical protein
MATKELVSAESSQDVTIELFEREISFESPSTQVALYILPAFYRWAC